MWLVPRVNDECMVVLFRNIRLKTVDKQARVEQTPAQTVEMEKL